jgi:Large ribosomal RNA subunit accumulation protein YceD
VTKLGPELSRVIEVSRIPVTGSAERIIADSTERALVARRLGLPAVSSLTADLMLTRWHGEGVKVAGRFDAEVEQVCVVTLDPFPATVSDTIERYFLPNARAAEPEADIDSFADGVIELGEVVVESLSLALDPYPRKPGAEFHGVEDGPGSAEPVSSPFAVLAGAKPRKR